MDLNEIKFFPPEHYLVIMEYLGKIPMQCPECKSIGYKEHEDYGKIPCVCGQRICPECNGRGQINNICCSECFGYGYQIFLPRFI